VGKTITFINNFVGVETPKKSKDREQNSIFVEVKATNNRGSVAHCDCSCKFSPGDEIYFGNKFTTLNIEGKDLLIMDKENVIAVVQAEKSE